MRAPLTLLCLTLLVAPAAAQDDAPPPNFRDHVQPLLRENCVSCHRGSRARNGLELTSAAKILAGGSSGPAVAPGDADGSLLIQVVEHRREPFMPPDEDRLDDATVATLRAWIAGGARVDANDTGAPAAPTEVPPLPVVAPGEAPMPVDLPAQPEWWSERAGPVVALAASPGAPLAAVGGFGQVSLYALPDGELLGVLPFPEGRPERLSFSATGAVLVAAGGRGGERGLAVGWDVASGARLFALGDEPDVALDADVTVDLTTVALGGPDRVVRAFDTRTGALRWEGRAHTDWVTAVAFSPDGVLLATGDRAGGVQVWEAFTGREFHRLEPGRGPITALAWRSDAARLVVADDSGAVRVFEPEDGRRLANWNAHGGVLDATWLPDGGLATVGRDGLVRLTDGAGKQREKLPRVEGASLAVAAAAQGGQLLVGDRSGRARVLTPGAEGFAAELPAHPAPQELRALQRARAARERVSAAHSDARGAVAEASDAAARAAERAAAADERVGRAEEAARAARLGADEASANAVSADAERGVFAPGLQARRATLAAVRDAAAQAEQEDEAARAVLAREVEDLLAAEEAFGRAAEGPARTNARAARELALRLVDGATAAAQLAAARAAEASVALERAQLEDELWSERSLPALRAAEELGKAAAHAVAAALAKDEETAAALADREARISESRALDETANRERERAAALAAELAELEQRVPALERAWAALEPRIHAAGGRVPRDSPE